MDRFTRYFTPSASVALQGRTSGYREKPRATAAEVPPGLVGRATSVAAVIALACFSAIVTAGEAVSPLHDYEKHLKQAQSVSVLGPDLFGEVVNLRDGATSFTAVDIRVPTQHGIPVILERRLGINAPDQHQFNELLGNWKLVAPYIHGIFDASTGWVSSMPDPQQRCSVSSVSSMAPPARPSAFRSSPTTFYPEMYWAGNEIVIPGAGDETMLYLPSEQTRPADGRLYFGGTKSNWRVSCGVMLKNGPGEGFVVTLTDGTRYTFDWISSREVRPLEDTVCGSAGNFAGELYTQCSTGTGMWRNEYYIHATRADDRFGNSVTYTYDIQNPRLLTRVASSDGAYMQIAYVDGKVSSVSSSVGSYTFEYVDITRQQLAAVVRPDASRWGYAYTNINQSATEKNLRLWRDCSPMVTGQQDTAPVNPGILTIAHPSGAQGIFRFRRLVHGMDNTPGSCYDPNPDGMYDEQITSIPAAYEIASLYEKELSGPGLSTQRWDYRYNPSYSWNPTGDVPPACTPNCTGSVLTVVTNPDGTKTRSWFGNDYFNNLGQLVRVDQLEAVGTVASARLSSYVRVPSGQRFLPTAGQDPNPRNNPLNTIDHRPQLSERTYQDGHSFGWLVDSSCGTGTQLCFSEWAQPTKVIKSSRPDSMPP